jgi:hypothetical protein
METTKGKTTPEALRMIAGWIEEGREIQCRLHDSNVWEKPKLVRDDDVRVLSAVEYRAKPRKPLIGILECDSPPFPNIPCIELTSEVIEACKAAGIEYE